MNRYFIPTFIFLAAGLFSQDVLWPTRVSKLYSSNFGENRDDHFHMGLDIKTNGVIGQEILAVEDGFIHRMTSNYNGYGKALYLTTISGQLCKKAVKMLLVQLVLTLNTFTLHLLI